MKNLRLILSLLLLLTGCAKSQPVSAKPTVIVSFYVLEDFTRKIAGDNITLIDLVPGSGEPHDYEPSTQDIVTLSQADALFILGNDFEPWYKDVASDLGETPKVFVLSEGIDTLTLANGQKDPHLWTSLRRSIAILANIRDALIAIDPKHSTTYQANYLKAEADFMALDQDIREALKAPGLTTFVTSHAAFGYFASDYGLNMVSVMGLQPEGEPDPASMQRVIDRVKQDKIPMILSEDPNDTRIADAIASETGAKTGILRTLENLSEAERQKGEDYLSLMRWNLDVLKEALNP